MFTRGFNKVYMKALWLAAKVLPISKPTMFIGKDSSLELCRSIALMGIKKLLIVTDAGIVQLGFVEKLSCELEKWSVAVECYSEVTPDPTYDQAEAAVALYKQTRCGAVLAIGGGSPLDCGKAVAALATNKKPIKKLTGLLKLRKAPAPLFVIPTTAGTGSEVTVAAVVSDPFTHQKTPILDHKLMPVAAALDAALMLGLPPHVTAQTGMDALTHAVESYISGNATPETDRYALAAVKLISRSLETTVSNGKDLEAREDMALASYYAGLAFTKAGLGYTHAIAHTLGSQYGTPHGLANAVVLPHVLRYSKSSAAPRLAELAETIGIGEGSEDKADAFISWVRDLQLKLGIPETLEAMNKSDIPEIARQACLEAVWNYPVPKFMEQKDCEKVVAKLLPAPHA
ncbi:iron-containing alcohol dehydrogenase [Parasalinivibrio latis]